MVAIISAPILPQVVESVCVDQGRLFYRGALIWPNFTYGYTGLTEKETITSIQIAMMNTKFLPPGKPE
jgi:hypothetical protein